MIKQEAIHWSDQVICRLELSCCANAWQRESSNTTCQEYSEMFVARGNLGLRATTSCKEHTCISFSRLCASLQTCQLLKDLVSLQIFFLKSNEKSHMHSAHVHNQNTTLQLNDQYLSKLIINNSDERDVSTSEAIQVSNQITHTSASSNI